MEDGRYPRRTLSAIPFPKGEQQEGENPPEGGNMKRGRGGSTAVDMTQGTPWKQILRFALPLLLGNLLQQLYNTVDAAVVGNFVGSEALPPWVPVVRSSSCWWDCFWG